MLWISILAKNTRKNVKKQQPTENQNITRYQGLRWRGPVFTFSLPGGAARSFSHPAATPLPMTLLWKGTSAPVASLLKGQGGNEPALRRPLSQITITSALFCFSVVTADGRYFLFFLLAILPIAAFVAYLVHCRRRRTGPYLPRNSLDCANGDVILLACRAYGRSGQTFWFEGQIR